MARGPKRDRAAVMGLEDGSLFALGYYDGLTGRARPWHSYRGAPRFYAGGYNMGYSHSQFPDPGPLIEDMAL